LHKKYLIASVTAIFSMGLVGCGNNDETARQDLLNDVGQPIGYYSNDDMNNGGNARVLDEKDGPYKEFYDHTIGSESEWMRKQAGKTENPNKPLANYDKSFFERDNRFSHSDANYHGHLDDQTRKAKNSYYTAYEGELAEKIGDVTASVENVEDVRSVVYGSNVLIAVDLTDYSKDEETKEEISQAVKPYLRGRSTTVVTDEGTFSRIRNIDNDLRDGGPREQIDLDIKDMFRTIRNGLQGNMD
jgi:spore cortex protein